MKKEESKKKTLSRAINRLLLSLLILIQFSSITVGQSTYTNVDDIPVNYDEVKVPSYSLPDPLIMQNGKKVKDIKTWKNKRRAEILSLFENEQFGKTPDRSQTHFKVFETGTEVFDGKAIRKQVTLFFTEDTSNYKADLLIYLPTKSNDQVPLLLKIGFLPNFLAVEDPGVRCGMMWNHEKKRVSAAEGQRWGSFDVEKFISNGIGVAFMYYGDIEPDFPEGIKYGIRGQYLKSGQTYPAPDEWGAISAWSWGLSCAMDYIETDQHINSEKVALFGISRLGKTVLWTGARDARFEMVIASCSGEGGAALSRRQFGETTRHMTDSTRFFYQFCGNRARCADDPNSCPVDAHLLISLIAPRPLLLQTGSSDHWSDPKGEFDAAVAAEPVYELLGKKGLETHSMPAADTPILNDLGYYMHTGGHGTVPSDYDIFLEFIIKHFKGK